MAYLQTKHQPKKILAVYLIRQIWSIQDLPNEAYFDFDAYLLQETKYLIDCGLDIKAHSLEEILSIVNSYLPEDIDAATWRDASDAYKIYARPDGELYPIYNDIYLFRNMYLVELVEEKREHYDRIFIVMGGQHLVDTKEQLTNIYDIR